MKFPSRLSPWLPLREVQAESHGIDTGRGGSLRPAGTQPLVSAWD